MLAKAPIYRFGNQCLFIRAADYFQMWIAVCILGGCSLWIAVLGQELQQCGQRLQPLRSADSYPPRKTEAQQNSWPWHVGVYSSALGPFPFCGGTLIAPKWVLTAAHCIAVAMNCRIPPYGYLFSYSDVMSYEMAVRVADHKYTLQGGPAYNVRVQGIIVHPSYNGTSGGLDIALLKLNREVKRSSRTEYACLPEPGFTVPVGHFCYVAGWGYIPSPPNAPPPVLSETLMELRIPTISTDLCKTRNPYVKEQQDVCTQGSYGMACDCDSGGGLHCLMGTESKWVLYAVLYNGNPQCFGGFNIFTLTAPNVDWMKQVMDANT